MNIIRDVAVGLRCNRNVHISCLFQLWLYRTFDLYVSMLFYGIVFVYFILICRLLMLRLPRKANAGYVHVTEINFIAFFMGACFPQTVKAYYTVFPFSWNKVLRRRWVGIFEIFPQDVGIALSCKHSWSPLTNEGQKLESWNLFRVRNSRRS